MAYRYDRKHLNQDAETMIECAIGYLRYEPCVICRGHINGHCWYGVTYIGTCPVAKGIRNYLKEQNNG